MGVENRIMYTIVYTVYDDYGLDTQQEVGQQAIQCPNLTVFDSQYQKIMAKLKRGGYSWHESNGFNIDYFSGFENSWAKVEVITH